MTDSLLTELAGRTAQRSPEDREKIRRIMNGEADNDLIRRGDVIALIRELRTNPVPSLEFQKALSAVQRKVSDLDPRGSVDAT